MNINMYTEKIRKSLLYLFSIVFSLLYSCGSNVKENSEERVGKKIAINRKYVGSLKKINSFSYDYGVPAEVILDNPYYWILDSNKQALLKIKKNGDSIEVYGDRGRGPDENERIKDVYVTTEWYAVIDNSKNIFKYVSLENDSTLYYHKFYDHIDHGRFLNDSLLAITNTENMDLLINIVNSENQIKSTVSIKNMVGESVRDVANLDLIYEGEFTRASSEGVFFYFCYRHSLFICIDLAGNVKYVSNTLDGIEPPKPADKTFGKYTVHSVEPDIMVNSYANTTARFFIVLSNVIKKENKAINRAIDFYKVEDGKYDHSISIPILSDGQVPIKFDVMENYLLVLYENFTIVEYEISQ